VGAIRPRLEIGHYPLLATLPTAPRNSQGLADLKDCRLQTDRTKRENIDGRGLEIEGASATAPQNTEQR
jgi:hypothetical protein